MFEYIGSNISEPIGGREGIQIINNDQDRIDYDMDILISNQTKEEELTTG